MKKILMIDDDLALTRIVETIFTSLGYAFVMAGTGKEGIRQVEQVRPDAVILDVNLPDMLGYEVCKSIRGTPATQHIPIVMLTGQYIRSADKVKGFNLGADDYVIKPFDNDVLVARLEALLSRKS